MIGQHGVLADPKSCFRLINRDRFFANQWKAHLDAAGSQAIHSIRDITGKVQDLAGAICFPSPDAADPKTK